jgi:hypothetical protein
LAYRSFRLEQSVTDARVACEDKIEKWSQPDGMGGKIVNKQKRQLARLINHTDDRRDDEPEARLWAGQRHRSAGYSAALRVASHSRKA